jgi:hypothetical protein
VKDAARSGAFPLSRKPSESTTYLLGSPDCAKTMAVSVTQKYAIAAPILANPGRTEKKAFIVTLE